MLFFCAAAVYASADLIPSCPEEAPASLEPEPVAQVPQIPMGVARLPVVAPPPPMPTLPFHVGGPPSMGDMRGRPPGAQSQVPARGWAGNVNNGVRAEGMYGERPGPNDWAPGGGEAGDSDVLNRLLRTPGLMDSLLTRAGPPGPPPPGMMGGSLGPMRAPMAGRGGPPLHFMEGGPGYYMDGPHGGGPMGRGGRGGHFMGPPMGPPMQRGGACDPACCVVLQNASPNQVHLLYSAHTDQCLHVRGAGTLPSHASQIPYARTTDHSPRELNQRLTL